MKKPLKITLHVVLYLFYLFIILEVVSRVALNNDKFWNKIRQGNYVAASKWRLEWVKRHKSKNEGNFDFGYDEHHPILGWTTKANIRDMPVFRGKFLNTNSQGVRGTREFNKTKNPNKTRIIILGESFTFGTEVSDDECYPYYLQQLMPNTEVINLGIHGYGYDQMLLYLQEVGQKYNPDIVIIPYLELDRRRSLLSFRDYAKPYFSLNNGQLKLENTPVPTPPEMFKREVFRSKFLDIVKILIRNIEVKKGIYHKKEEEITKAVLHEIVDLSREIGAIPIFAYIEGVRDVKKKTQPDAQDKAFMDYWNKNNVPSIYLLKYVHIMNAIQLKALGVDRVVFKREYGHFSPRENAIIAMGIKDFLATHGFVK